MKINDIFGGSYIKAADLHTKNGKRVMVPVTIEEVHVRDFDDGKKLELSFQGKDKRMICNKTNANSIAVIHGDDIEGWRGKSIGLYAAQTQYQGCLVPCIRVSVPDEAPPPPAMGPDAEEEDDIPF